MKPKKYESVNYIAVKENINKHFKILSAISIIMALIAAFICLYCMKLAIENDSLKLENQELNQLIQMKNSQITDLEEYLSIPLDVLEEDK